MEEEPKNYICPSYCEVDHKHFINEKTKKDTLNEQRQIRIR